MMQRGEAAVKKGGRVWWEEVFLPDCPFPIADSQGKEDGAWINRPCPP